MSNPYPEYKRNTITVPAPVQQPAAWVDVKDTHHGPYEFHGKELLPTGKHDLYTSPQPAQQQEPVAAAKKDAVFSASIEFIGTLTGMKPPPIEVAPPEILKPFRDFTEKVCSIFAAPQPAQRKPLTDEQIADILPDDDTPMSLGEAFVKFARAIEAAHQIGVEK